MVGRNDLCPCGSGKKYKKCCLVKDEAKEIAKNRIINGTKKFEGVIQKIKEFSNREEYKDYKNKFEIEFGISNYILENITNVYYLTNYKYNKQTSIMMDYFNRNKNILNKNELSIVENTLNSYMSIYQVKEKDINKILIKDILLDQNVYVEDIELFSVFDVGDYILARIISIDATKIFLDRTTKIDEDTKDKIKKCLESRYEETKKKVKTKKQCLINNIKFMYKNIVELYKDEVKEIACDIVINKKEQKIQESIVEEITDVLKKPIDKTIEAKTVTKQADEDIVVEINKEKSVESENLKEPVQEILQEDNIIEKQENKKKKQVMARRARASKNLGVKKRVNKRLEEKLKQRLKITKQIQERKQKQDMKQKKLSNENNNINSKLSNKIENIPTYKAEQIESKIDNISVSKVGQIESKIENTLVAKMNIEPVKRDDCRVYDVLISKIEDEYKEKCISTWERFKRTYKTYKGSENGWAAAIEYYVKKSIDETVTQEQISKKYNISIRTLGKRYKELLIC